MKGSIAIPFSELFADTADTHGLNWACDYYLRRGMPAWEVRFWMIQYLTAAR